MSISRWTLPTGTTAGLKALVSTAWISGTDPGLRGHGPASGVPEWAAKLGETRSMHDRPCSPMGRIIDIAQEREGFGMSGRRLGYGIMLLIVASIVVAIGYTTAPSASACNAINPVNAQARQPPRCSSTPATWYFVIAGILAGAGLLSTAPWWLRRIGGHRELSNRSADRWRQVQHLPNLVRVDGAVLACAVIAEDIGRTL
jgi:hypothetical protein